MGSYLCTTESYQLVSDIEIPLSFPLDADGFIRRACPICSREFKWRPSTPADESLPAAHAYFCPYCRSQAEPDQWFTEEQVAFIHDEVMEQVVNPSLGELNQSLENLGRASRGLIEASLDVPKRQHAPPIFEPNDMRLVQFTCHPDEPLKIADSWTGVVHCLVCGESTHGTI